MYLFAFWIVFFLNFIYKSGEDRALLLLLVVGCLDADNINVKEARIFPLLPVDIV